MTINWSTHIVQLTETPVNAYSKCTRSPDDYGSAYTTLTTTGAYDSTALDCKIPIVFIRTTTSAGYQNLASRSWDSQK